MSDQIYKNVKVVPLHHVPHLMHECCNLLNMEWKRSEVARLRSLSVSCDELPTCLILVRDKNDPEVIGHSKLTRIPTVPDGCFVESVIIHPSFRRKGLGKYLMNKTEDYAKSRSFSCMYLSTHDQEIFYGKLGYNFCPPVSIYGSAISKKDTKDKGLTEELNRKSADSQNSYIKRESFTSNSLPITPPPPPPPMPNYKTEYVPKKFFMNKQLF